MNFTSHATLGSQENIFGGGALDGSRMPRTKQRTVLGVLSENEQQSRAVCLVLFIFYLIAAFFSSCSVFKSVI